MSQQIIDNVNERLKGEYKGMSKKLVTAVVKAILDEIKNTVSNGSEARFIGFGAFKPVTRSARTARNPQTGAEMKIPAKNSVKFTAAKQFKDSL